MDNVEYFIYTDGFNEIETLFFEEVSDKKNVTLISKNTCYKNRYLFKLFRIHLSHRINNIIKLPFQRIWYRSLDRCKPDYNGTSVYIFMASWYYPDFFAYLRKKHPNAKLVVYFGDTIISKQRNIKGLSVPKLQKEVDAIYSYNPKDVKDYEIRYLPMCYSKSQWASCTTGKSIYDLVFVGASKTRYKQICDFYNYAKKFDLKVFFYIYDRDREPVSTEDFIVTDELMSMHDYLQYVGKSRALLEIVDGESEGGTLRFWEAVMYDKFLITNDKHVHESEFFDARYIKYYSDLSDLSLDFMKLEVTPDFKYNGVNSPIQFINKIATDLL